MTRSEKETQVEKFNWIAIFIFLVFGAPLLTIWVRRRKTNFVGLALLCALTSAVTDTQPVKFLGGIFSAVQARQGKDSEIAILSSSAGYCAHGCAIPKKCTTERRPKNWAAFCLPCKKDF